MVGEFQNVFFVLYYFPVVCDLHVCQGSYWVILMWLGNESSERFVYFMHSCNSRVVVYTFNEIQSLANMFCLASSDIGFNIYNSWTGQNKSYLNLFCLHEYACVHNINSLRFNAESYVCCFWCVFFFLHHFKNCSIHIFLNFLSLSDYLSLTFNALVSSGCKSK